MCLHFNFFDKIFLMEKELVTAGIKKVLRDAFRAEDKLQQSVFQRNIPVKQIVTAVSQGAVAALTAFEDIANPYWKKV